MIPFWVIFDGGLSIYERKTSMHKKGVLKKSGRGEG